MADDDDDDPFDLMPSSSSDNAAASSMSNNSKLKHQLTEAERFKIIDGVKVERSVVEYDAEEEKQAQKRQEEDFRHSIRSRKVMHRHNRSTSRSRSASNKARDKINEIDDEVDMNA